MPRSPGLSSWRMRMPVSLVVMSRPLGPAIRAPALAQQRELKQHGPLQQRVEIVVGNEGEHGLAPRSAMDAEALHVVDFEAGVALQQRRSCDARAGRDLSSGEMAPAH